MWHLRRTLQLLVALALTAMGGCGSGEAEQDPCHGVDCPPGSRCVDGECVLDTPTPGGPCVRDADCAPSTPICDANFCRPCVADEECGAGRACNSGRCEPRPDSCSSSSDCFGDTAPYCHPSRDVCVACTVDAHCLAFGQECERDSGLCFTPTSCRSDEDCSGPDRPRCDPARAVCVGCVEDSDCDEEAGQTCDRAARACRAPPPCESDDDCAGDPSSPACDVWSGRCVGCLEDEHCVPGTGRTCDPGAMTCIGGIPCESPWGCVDPALSRCDTRLGFCVDCMSGADCAAPGSVCDSAARACLPPAPCSSDESCEGTGAPICDPASGFCVECSTAEDCGMPGVAVCRDGWCSPGPHMDGMPGSPCRDGSDCANATAADRITMCLGHMDHAWRWHRGYCTALCDADAECPEGSVCLGGECRDRCASNDHCRAGYACARVTEGTRTAFVCAPQCEEALAATLSCDDDSDCSIGVCDEEAGRCACSPVGGTCKGRGYCGPGARCDRSGYPGGYCLVDGCAEPGAKPCPEGSSCYRLDSGSACLADCDPNTVSSCPRAEYGCSEVERYLLGGSCLTHSDCPRATPICHAPYGGEGTCIRTCVRDGDCDDSLGHVCVVALDHVRLCADPFQLGACLPGCSRDSDCKGCRQDEDCPSGMVCVEGACRRPCDSGADCAGDNCVDGLCAKPCIGSAACPRGSDCEQGACTAIAYACDPVVRRCDPPCERDADCDRARTCDVETGRCLTACDDQASDCGPAGRCNLDELLCELDCRLLPGACPSGAYCNPVTGDCDEVCPPFGAGSCEEPLRCDIKSGLCVWRCADIDRPCTPETSSEDCERNEICRAGYCTATCNDDSDCVFGFTCQWGVCSTCSWPRWRCDAEDTGLCFECHDDAHCDEGEYCDTGGEWRCKGRCGEPGGGVYDCPPGLICDESAGGMCVTPCQGPEDCGDDPTRPYCHEGSGLCGACGADEHCLDASAPRCDPASRSCVACLGDDDCEDPAMPVCQAGLGACVVCLEDSHCEGHEDGSLCSEELHSCVECFHDADCPVARPLCDPETLRCLGCEDHGECEAGTLCHPGPGECHPPCGFLPHALSRAGAVAGPPLLNTFVGPDGGAAASWLFAFEDGAYAYTAPGALEGEATLRGFGFSVPADALVTGFGAALVAGASEDDGWQARATLRGQLGLLGEARSAPLAAGPATFELGGEQDDFGHDWTPDAVNDTSFGLRLELVADDGIDFEAFVDRVRLTVFYSIPAETDCASLEGGEDFYCREDNLCDL